MSNILYFVSLLFLVQVARSQILPPPTNADTSSHRSQIIPPPTNADTSSLGQSFGQHLGQALGPQTLPAECPHMRRTNANCGSGPDRMDCPPGSFCTDDQASGSRICCWNETEIATSPCEAPLMSGRELYMCRGTCPNPCYTCQSVSRTLEFGLCCPNFAAGCSFAGGAGAGGISPGGTVVGGSSVPTGGITSPLGGGAVGVDPRIVGRSPTAGGFGPMGGGLALPGIADPRLGAMYRTPLMMGELCYGIRPPVGVCVMPFGACPPFSRCLPSRSGRGICCPVGLPGSPGPIMPMSGGIPVGPGPVMPIRRGIPVGPGPVMPIRRGIPGGPGPVMPIRRLFRR